MIKTFQYQNILPSLPVVSIEDTAALYLSCLKPLVSLEEYHKTSLLISEYLKKDGVEIHKSLLDYSNQIKPKSWMLPYSQNIYLEMRDEIILTGNYCVETISFQDSLDYSYLEFVALLASSIGQVYLDVVNETLKPMMQKDQPLAMSQVKSFLCEQRVIAESIDKAVTYQHIEQVNSFGLFYKNHYFIIRLINEDGSLVNEQELYNVIYSIYNSTLDELKVNYNTIAFSGSIIAYKYIEELNSNDKELFEVVNSAMFNITLKDCTSINHDPLLKYYSDTKDIWPYKGWSINVYQDLVGLFNNEHSFMDGTTSVYLIENVVNYLNEATFNFSEAKFDNSLINELKFDFVQTKNNELHNIKANYLELVNELEHNSYLFNDVPVKKLRELRINIDCLFQLAVLYAQRHSFKNIKVTHESVSANHYYDGRTCTLQSVSNEGLAFVDALFNNQTKEHLDELLVKASSEHLRRIKLTKDFCSIIRYRAAVAELINNDICDANYPNIFEDESFIRYSTAEISTSTYGNNWFLNRFAFAPVSDDGVGIGYISHNDVFLFEITYYKRNKIEMSLFDKYLNEFFEKIKQVYSID